MPTPDPTIRPQNAVLLIALQSGPGVPATLDPAVHAVPFEADSIKFPSPFKTEQSNEATGSLNAAPPMIIGQPAPFSFRSRMKGAGAGVTYTASVKPPLHAALSACGLRGQFLAAVSAAALTAGTTTSGTLGTGFGSTAQMYRGMPLILTGGVGAGLTPLITDYSAAKVATLSETMPGTLTTATSAAIPANWTYAPTTPVDVTARATDHPYVTIGYYEDGVFYSWQDCRGMVDLDGESARSGFASFNFTGVYTGKLDVAVPANAVIPNHSGPLLLQGAAASPAIVANRLPIPISKWSLETGGQIESPDDPNTPAGFQGGQIGGRTPMFKADPLSTLKAVRDVIAEIGTYAQYPIALRFGSVQGNRWSLLQPIAQPVDVDPTQMRGALRAEQLSYQAVNPGRDAYSRDGDRVICFF